MVAMATLAAAPSAGASAAVIGMPASVGVARPLLHPGNSAAAVRSSRLRLRYLPPAGRAGSPRPLRLVASCQPLSSPVTKMTSTAAASAASWAAAVLAPVPRVAAAAPSSLGELAASVARILLEWARVAAERAGADLSAPWAAVVGGTGRCLELYREILLVRCLLTWFPNVPWERQPFSAMRDLCDPFLRLFQRVVPPVFGRTLDVSSLLAFTALGILARILSPPGPASF